MPGTIVKPSLKYSLAPRELWPSLITVPCSNRMVEAITFRSSNLEIQSHGSKMQMVRRAVAWKRQRRVEQLDLRKRHRLRDQTGILADQRACHGVARPTRPSRVDPGDVRDHGPLPTVSGRWRDNANSRPRRVDARVDHRELDLARTDRFCAGHGRPRTGFDILFRRRISPRL